MNGFQGFGAAGTVVLVILHRNMVGIPHFQPFIQLVKRRLITVVVLPYLRRPQHFHHHWEVFLVLRRFVVQIEYQRKQQHTGSGIPKRVVGLASLGRGRLEEIRHHFLHVVIALKIGERVIAMAFFHVQEIDHTDFIPHFFQKITAVP